ncbi:EF-hand domain-containing protein [Noviluteimonas gilva]|uniref:EF-hand domain-containing protein n=1 Tax=Noviluteimonas gilva TaxID=2682097 RepID=A0A7C9M541_9GAMM|nr:hypothetical protein [Lysobacter gilvus]MUV15142.1 hypothetical protein [Lysobacter gilvus]
MIKQVVGCALLVVLAAPAVAQVKAGADPARFDVADANKDGQVDLAEYGNFVEEWVLLNDADRDGKLSRDELKDAPNPSKFDTIDSNRDGFLVIEELSTYSDGDFAAMDANSDGKIDRAESAQRK